MDRRIVLGTVLALAGSLMLTAGAAGQASGSPAHPAHIHTGTCPSPGGVVAELSAVSLAMIVNGEPLAADAPVGQPSAVPVQYSSTLVSVPFADIIGGTHAVVVHRSADDMGTYIACGDIGGIPVGATELHIGLAPLNDSGASGVVRLSDNGDGSTIVDVFLLEPVAAAAAAASVAIVDFDFDPAALTVPVGTTVTWTNQGNAPHTATANDGSFNSKTLDPGGSFSHTFAQAGSFPYFCGVHPSMTGTISVE